MTIWWLRVGGRERGGSAVDVRVRVYVLWGEASGRLYVGISKFRLKRLRQHNRGQSPATKGGGPWVEVYSERFEGYGAAREREKYLKSGVGREWLRRFVLRGRSSIG